MNYSITSPSPQKKLNPTISILKAFCIMMVVLGHCGCSIPYAVQFLYMFTMPLFFFVSGYCFKNTSLSDPKRYFSRRLKGVYWPFVKWCIVFLLLHNVFIDLGLYGMDSTRYSLNDYISHAYYIVGHMLETEELIGAYWFLAALFSGSIFSWLFMKLIPRVEISALFAFISAILMNAMGGAFLDNIVFKFIPFSYIILTARTFEVAFLIIAGHWFADRKIKPFSWEIIILVTIITFVGSFYWKINTGLMFFNNVLFIPYQLTGVLFTWCLYSLFSYWHEPNNKAYRVMTYIGKNTLSVLTWHFLTFKIVSVLIIITYRLPLSRLAEFPVIQEYASKGWWVAYFAVAMIVCCGISYCNKWIKSSWLKL